LQRSSRTSASAPPTTAHNHPKPEAVSSYLEHISANFETEWKQLHGVLQTLPESDQKVILSQLMIMANGRTKQGRLKIVKQVQNLFLRGVQTTTTTTTTTTEGVEGVDDGHPSSSSSPQNNKNDNSNDEDVAKTISYVGHFARLKVYQRKLFAKYVFAALSQLHAPPRRKSKKEK
jgi:hypothetical protein